MKFIKYIFISFLMVSCVSQKEMLKKSDVGILEKLIKNVCEKDSLSSENKAIENLTNRKLNNYFHCSLQKLNSEDYFVKLILATQPPAEDISFKKIEVNGFNCFLYDDDISYVFWIPDSKSWTFLLRRQGDNFLSYLIIPYTMNERSVGNEIKL